MALLPVIGLIITIAEGPNPFGFFFFVSEPGLRLIDFVDRRVVHVPYLNEWLYMLLIMLVNIGIYFLVGWVLDAIIDRSRSSRQRNAV